MQFTLYLFLLGVILILQSTVLETVAIAGVKPDLVMLVVVLNGFLLGAKRGLFWDLPEGSWRIYLQEATSA
jgi:rod shape-determining protein MreD